MTQHEKKLNRKEALIGYAFIAPNFIGFLIITLIPVVMGLVYSFTEYDGYNPLKFVGLKNYIDLFKDDYFTISLKNNLIYTFGTVPVAICLSLVLAVILNQKLVARNMFRSIFYFPNLTSLVAVGVVWTAMFNVNSGPINEFLRALGVQNPPDWLYQSSTALLSVMIVNVWQSSGYYTVLFLGGLQGISTDVYEAAEIDGANKIQQFFKITIPLLQNTMFLVTIMAIINSFQVFGIIDVMTQGGPGRATNVLVYRIYQEAFQNYQFGYASAMAFFLFLMIFIFTIIQFKLQREDD